MPFISVIVPNYRHADYLDERIQSILNQTFQDFEVIILDDASPDGGRSKAVIEQYRGEPRVRSIIYNENNSGSTFKQWLKGMEVAEGSWIWVAESDDFCEDSFLEECVHLIRNNPSAVLVFTGSDTVDEEGMHIGTCPIISSGSYEGIEFIKKYLLFGNSIRNVSSVVFKKETALALPRDFMSFHAAGDYLFYCQIAEHGVVVHSAKILNHFRQHNHKVTFSSSTDGTEDREVFQVFKYLDDRCLFDSDKQKTRVLSYYFNRIFGWGYPSESIRHELTEMYLSATPLPLLYFRINYLYFRAKRFLKNL